MAAIKFADLSNVRTTNYIFDLDRFISFEGKTGPYLLYAAVRMKSLARRAAEEGVKPGPIAVELDAERALVLALDAFDEALRGRLRQAHAAYPVRPRLHAGAGVLGLLCGRADPRGERSGRSAPRALRWRWRR